MSNFSALYKGKVRAIGSTKFGKDWRSYEPIPLSGTIETRYTRPKRNPMEHKKRCSQHPARKLVLAEWECGSLVSHIVKTFKRYYRWYFARPSVSNVEGSIGGAMRAEIEIRFRTRKTNSAARNPVSHDSESGPICAREFSAYVRRWILTSKGGVWSYVRCRKRQHRGKPVAWEQNNTGASTLPPPESTDRWFRNL